MKLTIERPVIEIIAALLLVVCVSATSAAFASGQIGRTADGFGCNISLPQNASPAHAAPQSGINAGESSMRTIAATGCCPQ
jgi:hypothetical protein